MVKDKTVRIAAILLLATTALGQHPVDSWRSNPPQDAFLLFDYAAGGIRDWTIESLAGANLTEIGSSGPSYSADPAGSGRVVGDFTANVWATTTSFGAGVKVDDWNFHDDTYSYQRDRDYSLILFAVKPDSVNAGPSFAFWAHESVYHYPYNLGSGLKNALWALNSSGSQQVRDASFGPAGYDYPYSGPDTTWKTCVNLIAYNGQTGIDGLHHANWYMNGSEMAHNYAAGTFSSGYFPRYISASYAPMHFMARGISSSRYPYDGYLSAMIFINTDTKPTDKEMLLWHQKLLYW